MYGNFGGHLLFGFIGIPLLLLGFVLARHSFRLKRDGIRASAVVVAYRTREKDEGMLPVVEFEDWAGKRRRVELSCSAGPPVGESMEVVYDRTRPETVLGTSMAHLWMGPLIASVLGSLFVAQVGQVYGMLDLAVIGMTALGVVVILASAWLDSFPTGDWPGRKAKGSGLNPDDHSPDLAEPID